MMKACMQYNFPNADKPFYFPNSLNKTTNYSIVLADQGNLITADATGGAFNLTLPTLAAADDGWSIALQKTDSSANAVTVIGTINGVSNYVLANQYEAVTIFWNGSSWRAMGQVLKLSQVNIVGATALTTPAVGDILPIYDLSATANRGITLANLFNIVGSLTAEATVALTDGFPLYDTSAAATDFMTIANLAKMLNLFTEDTAPDEDADFLYIWDTSASDVKKTKPKHFNPFGNALFHLRDEKAAGTDGGTFTSGAWRTRTLASKTNEITGASVNGSSQVTLPTGVYRVRGWAQAHYVDSHKVKLANITDVTDEIFGSSMFSSNASGQVSNHSHLFGTLTVSGGPKVYELQHRGSATKTTDGFGQATGIGTEVYAELEIYKIG
jgi:hypothetical protein